MHDRIIKLAAIGETPAYISSRLGLTQDVLRQYYHKALQLGYKMHTGLIPKPKLPEPPPKPPKPPKPKKTRAQHAREQMQKMRKLAKEGSIEAIEWLQRTRERKREYLRRYMAKHRAEKAQRSLEVRNGIKKD